MVTNGSKKSKREAVLVQAGDYVRHRPPDVRGAASAALVAEQAAAEARHRLDGGGDAPSLGERIAAGLDALLAEVRGLRRDLRRQFDSHEGGGWLLGETLARQYGLLEEANDHLACLRNWLEKHG
jgi:hypothetical protein